MKGQRQVALLRNRYVVADTRKDVHASQEGILSLSYRHRNAIPLISLYIHP